MEQGFKIKVTPEKSREIQEIMFKHGFSWFSGSQVVKDIDMPYLFIYDAMFITNSKDPDYFDIKELPELCIEQVREKFKKKQLISFTSDFYWNQEVYFLNGDAILKGNIVMAKWVDEVQNTDRDFVELTFKILVDDPDYSSAFWKNAENCFKSKEELIKKISG